MNTPTHAHTVAFTQMKEGTREEYEFLRTLETPVHPRRCRTACWMA